MGRQDAQPEISALPVREYLTLGGLWTMVAFGEPVEARG